MPDRWKPDLPPCLTLMRAADWLTIRNTPSPFGRNLGSIEPGAIVRVDRDDTCLLYQGSFHYIRLVRDAGGEMKEPAYIALGRAEAREYPEIVMLERYLEPHRDDCEFPEELTMEWIDFELGKLDYALDRLHDHLGTDALRAKLPPRLIQTMQKLIVGATTPDVPTEELPDVPPVEETPTTPPPPPVEEVPEEEPPAPVEEYTPFKTSGNKVLYNGKEFRAIGFNLREAIGYGDIMRWATPTLLRRQLEIVKEIGGKTVRFYAAHINLSATEAALRTERFLNLLQEFGLFGIVVLDDAAQSDFRIKKSEKNYKGRLTHEFYGGGYRDEYIPYITEVLKRVGNHPNVFCFELANEPVTPHPPDPTIPQMEAMLNWMQAAVKVRKQYAPHKLDSNGFISSWEMGVLNAYDGFKFAEKAHRITKLASIHTYQGQRNLPFGDTEPHIKRELQIPNVPMYIGEIGLEPGLNDWGWLHRLLNHPDIKPRVFMVVQWALMGHEGAIQEIRQTFDIGTGDRVGMVQTYAKGMPGMYWLEYVNTYKQAVKSGWG